MNCYIIGSAKCNNIYIPDDDALIIAADGGYKTLAELGIKPSLTVGDFDTIKKPENEKNIIVYPCDKDETDTMIAIKKGIEKGSKVFFIYGGTGGREDHTYANIQLLSYLSDHDCNGYLLYDDMTAAIVKENTLCFDKNESGYISVFSYTENCIVTIKGLKYETENVKLINSNPLGVSNYFIGEDAEIEVKSGSALIMWQTTPFKTVTKYKK